MSYVSKSSKWGIGRWHTQNSDGYPICGCDSEMDTVADELPDDAKLCQWCAHIENGYEVTRERGGQVRRYGPTINTYKVIDMAGDFTESEVLAYCMEHVSKVKHRKGEPGYHPLIEHVLKFRHLGNSVYLYETGHEWTG